MSSASSPARSARSGSSSAMSTPTSQRTKSPIELTPRSKVKAMLASFDDDSDDEISRSNVSNERVETHDLPAKTARPSVFTVESDSDSDDDDDVPVAPRGRMAGRMLASDAAKMGEDENEEVGAYSRIKKQLMAKKEVQRDATPIENAPISSPRQPNAASDDEENMYSATPKKSGSKRASKAASIASDVESEDFQSTRNSHAATQDSDSDAVGSLFDKSRLNALVAKKRAERKAAEDAEKKKQAEARRRRKELDEMMKSGGTAETDSDIDDAENRQKLTQQARPTRKASKKAMEEMNRETQRMSRNMQLAHQAKTKKRYSTKDLFKRMGFRQTEETAVAMQGSSDAEPSKEFDTPPTSPIEMDDTATKSSDTVMTGVGHEEPTTVASLLIDEDEPPNFENILSKTLQAKKEKEKSAKEPAKQAVNFGTFGGSKPTKPRAIRVQPNAIASGPAPQEIDLSSDEESEPRPTSKLQPRSRLPVFDRLPAKKASEPSSLHALRTLAHLTSPSKKLPQSKDKTSGQANLAPTELSAMLRRKAREQAASEKSERIEQLKARGIYVQTDEEREREQMELENMLERARKQAVALAKKEKAARKKGAAEEDAEKMMDDSSDDESYVEVVSEGEEVELELSGSEDEDEEGEEQNAEEDGVQGVFIDTEANEDDEEVGEDEAIEEEAIDAVIDEVENSMPPPRIIPRTSRVNRVIEDDDDEAMDDIPAASNGDAQPSPTAIRDETAAAFGFDQPKAASLGLTQMFASSMLDSQSEEALRTVDEDSQQDSLELLRQIPLSSIPDFDHEMIPMSQDLLIRDSQLHSQSRESQHIDLGITQLPSQFPEATQMSEFAPTQDNGFQNLRTPTTLPHSTVDTVVLPIPESPLVAKKKGRLVRRTEAAAVLSDIDDEPEMDVAGHVSEDEDFEFTANAFDALRTGAKKAKKQAVDFDKKKSDAKGLVQEQADESEDEYAGLGGASDDESNDEMDEELKEMMDDGAVDIDERKLAAYYADKEREADEKGINKLYKDLTTGALRRKRGADIDDLSDSDDEAEERRRRKQREFAKMRKALMEDENIGKIATNPKKQAFLRAIEDRDMQEDGDFLDLGDDEEHLDVPESQSQSEEVVPGTLPDTNITTATTAAPTILKRKTFPHDNTENIPPFKHPRRTVDSAPKKARTLAEVRESVSFLLEEPHMIPESQFSDNDSDGEGSLPLKPQNLAIVDRLSAKRSAASISSDSNGALAFMVEKSSAPGFKVPSLLRRSTTNSSMVSNSSNGSDASAMMSTTKSGYKNSASKKSSIHGQAREAERRAVVEAAERRKREEGRSSALMKGRRSVLGVLKGGAGGFE